MDPRNEIRATLASIRRRWFALVWLRVGAWALAAVAVTLLVAVALIEFGGLRGQRLLAVAGAAVVFAIATALTIAWPWRRRPAAWVQDLPQG